MSRVKCLREERRGKETEGDPEQRLEFSGANPNAGEKVSNVGSKHS